MVALINPITKKQTMLKWIKRILLALVSAVLLLVIGLWLTFYFWKQDLNEKLPYESSIAETKNGPVEYVLQGNSDRYMLFIHGTPGSAYIADTKVFLENEYSVLAISRPGYFKTPLSSGESPKEQAELYKLLLDELDIDSVYVNGISGGGPSSVQFANQYPERTAAVILRAALTESIDTFKERNLPEKFFETEFGMWLGVNIMSLSADSVTKQKMKLYAEKGVFPMDQTNTGVQNDHLHFGQLENLQLETITKPVLIIHGTKDENVPFVFADNAHRKIPNSQLLKLKDKGHFVFWTAEADRINKEIMDFITTNEYTQPN